MFVEVPITNEIKDIAMDRAKRTIESAEGLVSKFQTNELQNKTIGFIGELIFKEWLKNNNINFEHEIVYGKADGGDFIVGSKIVEVKTGKMTWDIKDLQSGYRFFIAEQQLDNKADFYVNIQLDNVLETAYITGFISYKDTESFKIIQTEKMVNPAKAITISSLTNMKEFNANLNTIKEVK